MANQGIYKLWLVDRGARSDYYWGEGTMYVVSNYLLEYFNQICQKSSEFSGAVSSWSGSAASVGSKDLVVYFLSQPSRSIIQNRFNQDLAHGGGATYMSPSGMISEVHLSEQEGDRDYSRLVANIAFHELLHNKLDAEANSAVQDIHTLGGGLSSPTVNHGLRPSAREIDLMAKNLGREIQQYTLSM